MPLKTDDLSVGMWVAIEKDLMALEQIESNEPWIFRRHRESRVSGMPLRIVAISLPFVCVSNGPHRLALDTRELVFCRLDPKFVKSLISTNRSYDGDLFVVHDERPRQANSPQTERHERACPICGDRLIEKYADGVWCFSCRECGFSGGQSGAR